MKDWQRCMDGFSNSRSKSHLPAITSYTQTQGCHQKTETITWSSSEDDDLPTLNTKKAQVVMKLNFEECVAKASGQIKPRVSRSINTTQQPSTAHTENLPILSPSQPKSPILNVSSNKKRRKRRDFNVSITNDIAPLPESPTTVPTTPKSPIICSRRRRRQITCDEVDSQIVLTPTPTSPILSRKRLNLQRSRSPVLGSGRHKRRKRKMLQSPNETLASETFPHNEVTKIAAKIPSSSLGNISCFIEESTQAPMFNPPQAYRVRENHASTINICSQENIIEESSQESSANTTVHLIEMPLSQDLMSKPLPTQAAACIEVTSSQDIDLSSTQTRASSSQLAENMTPSSVEEVTCIEVHTSQSQSTPYSPNLNLDSACKSRARPVRNGLAQRLQRLVNRQRSTQRMWRHEKQSTASSQASGLKLRVESLSLQFQRWLALCCVLEPASEVTEQRVLLMLQPELMPREKPKPGSTISIFPPWQTFEPPGFQLPVVLGVHLLEMKRSVSVPDSTLHRHSEVINFSCKCALNGKDQCSSSKPGTEVLRSMFLGEAHASGTLHAVEELLQLPPTALPLPAISQTLSVSEAVALHSGNPSASLQLLVCVLRVCDYKCTGNSALTSQSSQQHHTLVIARDTRGQLCQVELQYEDHDVTEGDTLHFRHLSLTRRHCVERTPGLLSLVASLQETTPQFMFEFCAKSPPLPTNVEDNSWLPPTTSFLADLTQKCEGRISVVSRVLFATEKLLYVTDSSLVNCPLPYTLINVRSSAHVLPLSTGSVVCLRDISCLTEKDRGNQQVPYNINEENPIVQQKSCWHRDKENYHKIFVKLWDSLHYDSLSLDQFSCVLRLSDGGTYVRARYEWLVTLQPLASALSSLKLSLPPLTTNTHTKQLVSLQGVVKGVDEESAFSWPVCGKCSSELLQDLPGEGLRCALCTSAGPFPNHVELSVFLAPQPDAHHFPPTTDVKLKLLQRTVEQLLPGCRLSNEGYQLDAVLGQQVGPVSCLVHTSEDQVYVEEIPFI